MRTKLRSIYLKSFSYEYNVLAFTETWLKPDIFNAEVLCPNYTMYRHDRTRSDGGGVLIAVHDSIPSSLIDIRNNNDIEFISSCIFFSNFKIFVTCSYIPPKSDFNVYMMHFDMIKNVCNLASPKDVILVLGDFNIPEVSWSYDSDASCFLPFSIGRFEEFFNSIYALCLNQFNNFLNCNNRILDLVFCNTSEFALCRVDPFVIPEDNYHPTLKISFNSVHQSIQTHDDDRYEFDFKHADTNSLCEALSAIVWPSFDVDPRQSFARFYEQLHLNFYSSVPTKRIVCISLNPPWSTRELKSLKNRMNRQYRKYFTTNSHYNLVNYLVAKNKFTVKNQQCYESYLSRMRNKLNYNPRAFFSFVNSKRRSTGFPTYLKNGDKESSTDTEIANLFADFFQSTYTLSNPLTSNYPYNIQEYNVIPNILLTYHEVWNGLKSLKPNFSSGPDGVPASILRACADVLYVPLTDMFNSSLLSGFFPDLWKESYIIPLHKGGSRFDVANYRGIAILSAIPKLFEKLITCRLVHSIGGIFSEHQHGFVRGRSTVTNLLHFSSSIFSAFSLKLQTDVIYTDLSKAFDRVNHHILIHKLNLIGFPTRLLSWLSSYLAGRTQMVKFKSKFSRVINVTSGVPQGSHLGPILFVLYLNDLPSCLHSSNVLMYADDVKLFLPLDNLSDSFLLQEDFCRLNNWCEVNDMSLNLKKCKVMSFTRGTVLQTRYFLREYELDKVSNFKDLGILFDGKLRFNLHIDSCVVRGMSLLGFIKRWSREFDDPYLTKRLFTTLVRPVLEYGVVVWFPCFGCDIAKVESVQKQFLIFALRGLGWNSSMDLPPYTNRLLLINLPTLERRRVMLGFTFMHKLVNGYIDSHFLLNLINFNIPMRPSRHFIPLKLNFCKHKYETFNPLNRLSKLYNDNFNVVSDVSSINLIKRAILNSPEN